MNNIEHQLDKVLQLNQERNQVINRIKTIKTRNVGLHQLTITQEEKDLLSTKANKSYDVKISSIYATINQQLEGLGQEKLNNPFMKGEN